MKQWNLRCIHFHLFFICLYKRVLAACEWCVLLVEYLSFLLDWREIIKFGVRIRRTQYSYVSPSTKGGRIELSLHKEARAIFDETFSSLFSTCSNGFLFSVEVYRQLPMRYFDHVRNYGRVQVTGFNSFEGYARIILGNLLNIPCNAQWMIFWLIISWNVRKTESYVYVQITV